MKFVASYSCGKDSALAFYRAIQSGHTPIAILVSCNKKEQRSWFHGVDFSLLGKIADSLGVKLILCESEPENYNEKYEEALKKAVLLGAQGCVFGDIDIVGHREWDEERCRNAGVECMLPLWQEDREALTLEFIDAGFIGLVKCIDKVKLPEELLGQPLTYDIIDEFKRLGIDVCGENGEYHTLVVDGPLFTQKVIYKIGKIIEFDTIKAVDICETSIY